MRKLNILIIGFSLLFSTCNLEVSKGSLPIVLPKRLNGYSISRNTTLEQEYDYARIYLKTETGYFNIDTSTKEVYKDVAYSVGSYTITGLEPGEKYTVYVYFGFKQENVLHSTTHYAVSEKNFRITSGINNKIEMTIIPAEVTWVEGYKAEDIKQVLTIATSETQKDLYAYVDGGKIIKNGSTIDTGVEGITSIGKGSDLNKVEQLWLNTSSAIIPIKDGIPDLEFSKSMNITGLDIEESQGIYMDNDGEANIIVYYQGQGIIGGTQIDNTITPDEYDWYGKEDLINEVEGIEDMIDDLEKFVYDFESFSDYAFVVTALPLPSFLITGDVTERYEALPTPPDSDIPSFEDLKSIVDFIVVRNSSNEQVTIKTLTAVKSEGLLYFGSNQGIYYASFNPLNGALAESGDVSTIVTNTENENIIKLESGDSYIAAITDNGILIIKGTNIVKELDFYMGIPENISDIAWIGDTLYISGSSGLVTFDATGLWNKKISYLNSFLYNLIWDKKI